MDDYERILLVKPEVFVYRIPPLGSSRGYKAADWKLDNPDFVGRLRLICKAQAVVLKLEDKASGELFAKCPVDRYPGPALESVQDSSRYFVLRIMDDSGKTAIIGMGFADRGDSFDLNVTLQDHFKRIENDDKLTVELAKEADKPKLDLGFKEGQTITINLGKKLGNSIARPKSASSSGGPFSLPPPPPAGSRITVGAAATVPTSSLIIDPPSRNSPSSGFGPPQQQSANPFVNIQSRQGPNPQGTTPYQAAPFSAGKMSNPFLVQQPAPTIDNLLDL